ncbi:metallophosphoesterase [Chryseobacterium candidae]|uniref:Calcineurin-like phosphoesterase domain-containing protein n=1 Tax=Chryseobacterium candidae TaxID=1978493 RepID=A0ABY2R490_9FLAO|nr:metallophosphoesterase [Chryseobacterium candidae]THV57510.1 hypothetical protein EK417_15945 [Chryseobacterium candidae]
MNSIILHISDLHVSRDQEFGGGAIKVQYYLSTSKETEASIHFIDKFINRISSDFPDTKIYLLITGDITNSAEKNEFEFALSFITRIIDKLHIEKKNILIIPGDHDLNRRDIANLFSVKEPRTNEEVNIAKYHNFCNFYQNVLGRTFDPNKVIFDQLIVEDSIVLLGLNSCTQIDLKQKEGSIPIEKFEEEFAEISVGEKKIIACVHHNFTSSYENKNDGQWVSGNRQRFVDKLLTNGINFIFTGNEHANSSKTIFLGEITTSDAGCLTSKDWDASYKVYPIQISEDIVLKNKIFSLHKIHGNDSEYEWDIRTNKTFHQPEEYIIFKNKPPEIDSEITELASDHQTEPTVAAAASTDVPIEIPVVENNYYNSEFTDVLYDKVKELKIFYSGHFHWSETSRAHNWIDVSKLIENKDNLNFIKNVIVDVFETKIKPENIDLIIGLGYEGNIIATKTAIKHNKKYSFLPYSYRHDEHHEAERQLNFDNSNCEFRNVVIITDVVNDGRTIRKLIKKRQDPFFKNVEKIYVV